MFRRIYFVIAAIIFVGNTSPVWAQTDTGTLCVRAYRDRNGNGFFDSGEGLVEGAYVVLESPSLDRPARYTTGLSETPECVDALKPDLYTVTVQPPNNLVATTPAQLQIRVQANARLTVEAGVKIPADPLDT